MSRFIPLEIAVLILAAWVFLVNVTEVSDTVGWIMALAAFLFVVVPHVDRKAKA